ncbi:MAG: SIS domain-containing protein [Acidimicrobiales bacterium]|jgi:glucose/mannose-6-phosphate isomerase|nr:SIS domain-containing protein [Acidimicrobiales bacterium]
MSAEELLEALRHLPDQVRDAAVAAADVDELPERDGITQVAILGVGGGRVAADVIEAIGEIRGSVPIVATGARCPAWVGPSTLAIALSPSGDERATLAAVEVARDAEARLVAVTSGGALREQCVEWGVPIVPVDPEAGPAVGLGVSIVPVLVLLERLGLAQGMSRAISGVAEQLATRHAALDDDLAAIEALADVLLGRVAIVTGAGAMGKHAARRWVQEIDRVGGVAAVRRRLPTGPADVETGVRLSDATVNGAVLIVLRHDFEPDGLDGGVALLDGAFDEIHTFVAEGDGPLAQLLDLVLLADAIAAALVRRTGG